MDETALLLARMEDLAEKARRTGAAHSGFLSPGQAATVRAAYANRADTALQFDGGFAGAERCVAVFTQPDWGAYLRDETLAALRLCHRAQDEVRHKDVLGAVLGLGLGREVLGDICIEPGRATLVCLAHVAGFIAQQLGQVGRVGVRAEPLPLGALPDLSAVLEERQLTVASLRLDAVLAAAFNLSRAAAAQAVTAGLVQLAHSQCLNPSQAVQPGHILSLRGRGRVKLLMAGGQSRKGRLRIVLGYYSG